MEPKTVRKEMTAGDLKKVIDLPNYDDNQRVEITVTPTAEEQKKLSPKELEAILDKITGAIPYTEKTLDDWRKERLEERYGIKLAD
ncbi:MAG: hypothetical protein IKP64_04630 [Selenomonadaceae bacterium]|nr:hypothetical protein [Selenomonadaceae bacterium]MBR4382824.1 hypothetical protein [Selenomonadaceae bacterium]